MYANETNNKFKLHSNKYHTKVNPVCKVCGKSFENKATLWSHGKTCTKKENKLKFQNKCKLQNKENVAPSTKPAVGGEDGVSDSKIHAAAPESEAASPLPMSISAIPVSSRDSPVLVELLPGVYEMSLPFDQF